jgi:hypothetical protein
MLASGGKPEGDFARYAAWEKTGDTAPLVALHEAAIADKTQHMYMYTEGHWWTDRVDMPNEWLQRERLGGIALKRNQTWPGNAVSWRFADPAAAEAVAILVPGATLTHFRVVAFNTSTQAQAATMTAWNVTAGHWTMTSGTSSDDGKTMSAIGGARPVDLERSAELPVRFAPGVTTVYDFTLAAPVDPVEQRPDLGIGADDVVVKGRDVTVTVHSLGARTTTGGEVSIAAADGVLAHAAIPPLAAPEDLTPRTTVVRLRLPAAADRSRLVVRVALPGDAPEITRRNNQVPLRR